MPIVFSDHPEFTPDYSPYELFKQGIFQDWGGYFRPVYSSIAKKYIKDDYKQFNWHDLPLDKLISNVDVSKNKYKVPASLSLEEWEKNKWIHPTDNITSYRGWLGWYCLFFSGDRNPEVDDIQIKRWINLKKRFCGIKNKSDTVKQTLLNWGINCN